MDASPASSSPLSWPNSQSAMSPQEPDLDQILSRVFTYGDFEGLTGDWDDPHDSALYLDSETESQKIQADQCISPETSVEYASIFNDAEDNPFPIGASLKDESYFQSPNSDISPPDHLYSTPLSWERPQLHLRVSNHPPFAPLSPSEESRLRAIAMPSQRAPSSPLPLPLPLSPQPQHARGWRKRKSSSSSESDKSSSSRGRGHASPSSPPQKTAHNMIEKRYRTNLNHKIAALRDSVPSLRRRLEREISCSSEDSQGDLKGVSSSSSSPPVQKLNKATILSGAVEYIGHLEKRNKYFSKENTSLKLQINAFERLRMA